MITFREQKRRIFFFLTFFCFSALIYSSFSNSLFSSVDGDSINARQKWSRPKKAAVLSACLPGAGQLYNKKFWKIPIVYGILGGAGYFIRYNHSLYNNFKNAIIYRYDNIPQNETLSQYSVDNLVTLKRTYRRYRDFSIFGAALIYVLQVVDANVDAHLFQFDVDRISLRLTPEIQSGSGQFFGLGISIALKK